MRKVQRLLNERSRHELKIDGIFGPLTQAAVMNFQRDARLTADGVAGRRTLAALALAGMQKAPLPVAQAARPVVAAGASAARPPSTDIHSWSLQQIIIAVLMRTGAHLPAELASQWRALISARSLETIAATIAVAAAAHLVGVGEVVDAVLIGVGVLVAGTSAFEGGMELGRFMNAIVGASTEEDIDAAAGHLAHAVLLLGVATVMTLLLRKPAGGAADDTAAAKPVDSAPAKAPAPKAASAARDPAPAPNDAAVASTVNQPVYRVDGRPPGTIFNEGFQPRGTSTDLKNYVDTNSPSAFVSTSKTPAIADNPDFARPGAYLYEVDGAQIQGIDVNAAYPANPFAHEAEIAVVGGVPPEAIISAKPILPDGGLGPTIPNPAYNGGP